MIDFWPCEINFGLARSIFGLARSFLALQDRFLTLRDRLWPCEIVFSLAKRPMVLLEDPLPCKKAHGFARPFLALQEAPSTTYYCKREANPSSLLHRCRAVSWCHQSIVVHTIPQKVLPIYAVKLIL